jgi:hypothetical protein
MEEYGFVDSDKKGFRKILNLMCAIKEEKIQKERESSKMACKYVYFY